MKLPKTLLTAMLVAVTTGTICSCEKPVADATTHESAYIRHHPSSELVVLTGALPWVAKRGPAEAHRHL